MGITSLLVLLFIALVVIVFLNKEHLNIVKKKFKEERNGYLRTIGTLNKTISKLKEDKPGLMKDRQNITGKFNYTKKELEEERNRRKDNIETEKILHDKISQLGTEKIQICKELKTKCLTIILQALLLSKLENELAKIKEDYQSIVKKNEISQKAVEALKKKNKEAESLIDELKKQTNQIKKELENAQSQMINKDDNLFERISIW